MTKEIIAAIGKRQVLRSHTPVVANITTVFHWEVDLLSVGKSGSVYEFEVKISRSDFLRDKQKKKWSCSYRTLEKNTPNYMSYVCPDGLIKVGEIPDFAGLYYFQNGELTEVKAPKERHKFKQDINDIQMKVARMYSQREFLGCTLITHINRGIRERNNEIRNKNLEAQNKLMEMFEANRLNRTPNLEGSDTTGDATSTTACNQK